MASGQYSTAKGRKNNVLGAEGFAAGYNNSVGGSSSIALGTSNTNLTPTGGRHYTILIGTNNSMRSASNNAQNNILLGNDNAIPFEDDNVQGAVMLGYNNFINSNWLIRPLTCGNNLALTTNAPHYSTVYGNCNTSPSLTNAIVIIGAGSDITRRKNAIEINDTTCKIKHNLALATDTTEVNAITPPQDPNNVTTDDQTLVTKSFLPNFTLQSQKMLEYTDIAQAPTIPTDGTSFDFSSYIPTWAKHLWVYFKWEGESHTEDIMVEVNNGVHLDAQQYDTTQPLTARIEHDHVRMDYNATNKTLTAINYWYFEQDINTNTISNIDTTLANCPPVYVMSILATA